MRKSIQNVLVLFVVIVSIFTFINMVSVDRAEAVSCPEGLVCTPVNTAFVCPVGYTCTPAPTCPVGFTCKPIEIQSITCPSGYICKLTNNGGGSSGGSGSGGGLLNRCYRFDTNLSVGSFWTQKSTGADVVALQTILMEKGFDVPSVSSKGVAKGVFDADTKAAVIKFQTSINIPATGFVGPLTRDVLNSLCGSTNSPSITVLSPNGGESYAQGSKIRVKWNTLNLPSSTNLDVFRLRSESTGQEYDLTKNVPNVPDSAFAQVTIPSSVPEGNYKLEIKVSVGNYRTIMDASDYSFNIISSNSSTPAPTPYSTPITTSNTTNREAFAVSLLSTKVDKAGAWHTFAPGIGAGGTGGTTDPADWNWSAFLMLSSSKTVSSVTIRQANGEYWSTNNKQYFPLVIIDENGKQLTSQYVDNLITLPKGTYSWSLYGQKNTSSWVDGGYAEIAFSDGTKIKSYISANSKPVFICPVGFICNNNSPSPTPVSSPSLSPSYPPSVTVTSPNSGEIWSMGDKKTITWSYANWNSGIFGNKYVDMYLVPMDGRSPIKLATNFNSPDGTVHVTIYEKTSDGRNAWLPGRYKIRVVCNTNNVAPFNSCMDESDGYITVVSNPPSPTPIPNSTSMSDQTSLNASIWDAIKQYFDSKATE